MLAACYRGLWKPIFHDPLPNTISEYLICALCRSSFLHHLSVAEGWDAAAVSRLLRPTWRTDFRQHQLLQTYIQNTQTHTAHKQPFPFHINAANALFYIKKIHGNLVTSFNTNFNKNDGVDDFSSACCIAQFDILTPWTYTRAAVLWTFWDYWDFYLQGS